MYSRKTLKFEYLHRMCIKHDVVRMEKKESESEREIDREREGEREREREERERSKMKILFSYHKRPIQTNVTQVSNMKVAH